MAESADAGIKYFIDNERVRVGGETREPVLHAAEQIAQLLASRSFGLTAGAATIAGLEMAKTFQYLIDTTLKDTDLEPRGGLDGQI